MVKSSASGWAIKNRSESILDGKRENLMGRFGYGNGPVPPLVEGYTTMVFATRAKARAYIEHEYGYLRKRPDLREEPHGRKMPIAVRVAVEVHEI